MCRIVAAINARDAAELESFFGWQVIANGEEFSARELVRMHAAMWQAFSDLHIEIEDIFGHDEAVFMRATLMGTHDGGCPVPGLFGGVLCGVSPTGRAVRFTAMYVWRVASGRVVAYSSVRDDLSLKRQLRV